MGGRPTCVVVLGLALGMGCAGQHPPAEAAPTESFAEAKPPESTNPVISQPGVAQTEANEPLTEEGLSARR